MFKKKRVLYILMFITLSQLSCEKDPSKPENARLYTITLKIDGSSPVNGATVSIQTQYEQFTASTNDKGVAAIDIPNDVALPEKLIVTAAHSSVKPEAITVSGAKDSEENRTISCERAPSRVLIERYQLRHIGDDYYGGPENSQLQIPTEGTSVSYSFYLSNIPNSMPYIRFYARGIQSRTQIKINNITVDYLGNSSLDGSLSRYAFQLTANPGTVLKIGSNTLTIATVYYDPNLNDWDDLEFCSLLLYYP